MRNVRTVDRPRRYASTRRGHRCVGRCTTATPANSRSKRSAEVRRPRGFLFHSPVPVVRTRDGSPVARPGTSLRERGGSAREAPKPHESGPHSPSSRGSSKARRSTTTRSARRLVRLPAKRRPNASGRTTNSWFTRCARWTTKADKYNSYSKALLKLSRGWKGSRDEYILCIRQHEQSCVQRICDASGGIVRDPGSIRMNSPILLSAHGETEHW